MMNNVIYYYCYPIRFNILPTSSDSIGVIESNIIYDDIFFLKDLYQLNMYIKIDLHNNN